MGKKKLAVIDDSQVEPEVKNQKSKKNLRRLILTLSSWKKRGHKPGLRQRRLIQIQRFWLRKKQRKKRFRRTQKTLRISKSVNQRFRNLILLINLIFLIHRVIPSFLKINLLRKNPKPKNMVSLSTGLLNTKRLQKKLKKQRNMQLMRL